MSLEIDVQQGWHDAIVELFDIDLSPITGNASDLYYFTNQLAPNDEKIQWQGNTYDPLPIISSGYEKSTTGQIAQPTLTVANVLGTFTELISQYDDLVGAKVTRRRTLGKYLDGQIEADPLQEFPIDVYYIERKAEENALTITWELASILDLEGLKLPRRIIIQNLCLWKYRSSECGYTGAPLFNQDDQLIPLTSLSAEAATLISTWQIMENRRLQLEAAKITRNKVFEEKEVACSRFSFFASLFDFALGSYVRNNQAFISGVTVPLSSSLRAGFQRVKDGGDRYYELETWGFSSFTCSGKTAELAAADAAVVTATSNYEAAISGYTAAIAALPEDDPIYALDVCAKRVESCKLRFPRQALPFGGFPGASLRE
jgi:lambda family phage minor tail protein L